MSRDTETYRKLITAAASCFAEKGFSATSVREIANRADISQGAMYTYFKSKDELISSIVLEEQQSALRSQQETVTGTYLDRICLLVGNCISDVGFPVSHRLWVEIIAQSARIPSLRETFISSDKVMRAGIASILQEGIVAGEFRSDLNVEETTIFLFAIIDGLISRKAVDKAFSAKHDLSSFRDVISRILIF